MREWGEDEATMDQVREFYLEEIDAWRRGDKATPGCPASGERYAGRMQDAIKRLERALAKHEREAPPGNSRTFSQQGAK